jgi:GT2 family glycosyltransferase
MKPVVGIHFTSRNRPDVLEISLTQLYNFLSEEKFTYVISVVIDLGDAVWDPWYTNLMGKFPGITWIRSEERLGIARNKNYGIKILAENKCDHFFLFDDDAFPVRKGWEELYITTALQNNLHHLMHLFPSPVGFEGSRHKLQLIRRENGICEFSECAGVLMYFTRHVIQTVGGYRKVFGVYGYEHAELSLRIHFAGLNANRGPYLSPEKTRSYIYSLDLDLGDWNGVQPTHFKISPEMLRSSIQGEDRDSYIHHNIQFLAGRKPVFEEI